MSQVIRMKATKDKLNPSMQMEGDVVQLLNWFNEVNILERMAIESDSLVNVIKSVVLCMSNSALVCRMNMGALNPNPKY